MKIYFANMRSAKGLEKYLRYKIAVLSAYPSFPKTKPAEKPEFCNELFIDSGAFGKHGDKVVLEDYIEFIFSNEEIIDLYAGLDSIGDAQASWDNQIKMEEAGLDPLPVFHYGSNNKWLHKILDLYDHFALGGLVPVSKNYDSMVYYLDRIWEEIHQNTTSLPKVHGFGIQNLRLITRYPWDSVDASSVHTLARFGGIYHPEEGHLKINPNVNYQEGKWLIQKPNKKERIKEFVESYLDGHSFEEAQQQTTKGTLLRCAVSIHWITEYLETAEPDQQNSKTKSLF